MECLVEKRAVVNKRWPFLDKEIMTGNTGELLLKKENITLSSHAPSIPSTLLSVNTTPSGAVSPDHVIDDDRFWGHEQGVKPLWDFRELHPLRFKYLCQKHRAQRRAQCQGSLAAHKETLRQPQPPLPAGGICHR